MFIYKTTVHFLLALTMQLLQQNKVLYNNEYVPLTFSKYIVSSLTYNDKNIYATTVDT